MKRGWKLVLKNWRFIFREMMSFKLTRQTRIKCLNELIFSFVLCHPRVCVSQSFVVDVVFPRANIDIAFVFGQNNHTVKEAGSDKLRAKGKSKRKREKKNQKKVEHWNRKKKESRLSKHQALPFNCLEKEKKNDVKTSIDTWIIRKTTTKQTLTTTTFAQPKIF